MDLSSADLQPLSEPAAGLPDITHDDIDEVITALANGHGPCALDTERAMGIRYSARAYLIQIKRAGAGLFLIDPIGIESAMARLAPAIHTEWILHAADQDLPCLRELGLEPESIFDTELAGLILGYEHVSLQHMVAEDLGIALAKEHSNSDWSQRPLGPELRAYAALDVELLAQLRTELTAKLVAAGRWDWFTQECEEVRTRPLPEPHPQPWRKAVKFAKFSDQRSLAMLRELWEMREKAAQERDLAPGKVLPNKVLAALAALKLRSRSDVTNSPLMRSRVRRRDAQMWWRAIQHAWSLSAEQLPERKFSLKKDPFPPVQRWENLHPEAAERWSLVRTAVLDLAEELGIRQEVLLKPRIQKLLAWNGWKTPHQIPDLLAEYGARPWQIEQVYPAIKAAL